MPPFLPQKRLRSVSPEPRPSKQKEKTQTPTSKISRKQTLFEALDDSTSSTRHGQDPKRLLANLDGSDDDSDLSSLSSSEFEFEDVPKSKRQKVVQEESEDEDEDIEFEDVNTYTGPSSATPLLSGDLDLTLTKETRVSLVNPHNKTRGPSKIERQIRVSTHCAHVQFLMWHNAIRNCWICDKEVQNILVKQAQRAPTMEKEIKRWKTASNVNAQEDSDTTQGNGKDEGEDQKVGNSDQRSRGDWDSTAHRMDEGSVGMSHGDPLFRLLGFISKYWKQKFKITAPGLHKLGYMSLQRLDEELKSLKLGHDLERHGEQIQNKNEFRKLARKCEGSRDLGAQLFAALLRGLSLEARMVVSLQPVGFGWSKVEEAPEKKIRSPKSRKDEDSFDSSTEDESDNESKPVSTRSSSKGKHISQSKTSTAKLRKGATGVHRKGGKDSPIDLSEEEAKNDEDLVVNTTPNKSRQSLWKVYEKDLAPNYWVEVLSPVTNKYVSVNPFAENPVATNEKLLAEFEPRGAKAEKAKQVMAYIVAFSSDGTAKDVTVRYLKRHMWPGKTKGMRIAVAKVPVYNKNGKIKRYEEFDWFKTVMSGYSRTDNMRAEADDIEDTTDLLAVRLEKKEAKEGDETLQSYKSSVEFVLARHLRREEALLPGAQIVKMFVVKGKKGEVSSEEEVYLRKDVVNCKSVETWHKEGRAPVMGEQPLKRVPYRAATTNRKRELAEAEAASGGEKMLQGLYSRDQTDWIIPPPIENGVIPKNSYGNMDVYVPSMVPEGAVHIPRRGTMRICKKLGIDFAEAVTGFEFGARMAIPIITGVVVAEENVEMVLEQWHVDEAERARKEDEKRTKAALGMWRKFLMGLRIVERVREEYGDQADDNPDVLNPWTNKNTRSNHVENIEDDAALQKMDQYENDMGGGFLPEGRDVEEPAQSFFPTRHEHDQDDEEGGFMVEGDTITGRLNSSEVKAFATPVSMQSTKRSQEDHKDEDLQRPSLQDQNLGYDKKAVSKSKAPARHTPSKNRKGTMGGRKVEKTAATKGRPRGKKAVLVQDDDEDEAEESLSNLDSDTKDDEDPPPKPKRQATLLAEGSQARRVTPKRNAARKSETALRSHYFEHSKGGDDDE